MGVDDFIKLVKHLELLEYEKAILEDDIENLKRIIKSYTNEKS